MGCKNIYIDEIDDIGDNAISNAKIECIIKEIKKQDIPFVLQIVNDRSIFVFYYIGIKRCIIGMSEILYEDFDFDFIYPELKNKLGNEKQKVHIINTFRDIIINAKILFLTEYQHLTDANELGLI